MGVGNDVSFSGTRAQVGWVGCKDCMHFVIVAGEVQAAGHAILSCRLLKERLRRVGTGPEEAIARTGLTTRGRKRGCLRHS